MEKWMDMVYATAKHFLTALVASMKEQPHEAYLCHRIQQMRHMKDAMAVAAKPRGPTSLW
jgi:hypothetical protein